jgi:hypothetical protein
MRRMIWLLLIILIWMIAAGWLNRWDDGGDD